MKYFFPILMGFLILVGIVVSVTPFLGEWFFPAKAHFQQADSEDAKEALANWFSVPPEALSEVKAIRWVDEKSQWRWFRFRIARQPVEAFIVGQKLEQRDMDAFVLQQQFMEKVPPVDWWQPAALDRKSYFFLDRGGMETRLLYQAEQEICYLLLKSTVPQAIKRI